MILKIGFTGRKNAGNGRERDGLAGEEEKRLEMTKIPSLFYLLKFSGKIWPE